MSGGIPSLEDLLAGMGVEDQDDPETVEMKKALQEAPDVIKKIIDDLRSGKLAVPVSYKDPDQSPLKKGYECVLLREKWCSGMDMPHSKYSPFGMPYLSKFLMTLFLGNLDDFTKAVAQMGSNEVARMVRKREGYLCLSPVCVLICGARLFWGLQYAKMTEAEFKEEPMIKYYYKRRVDRKHLEIMKKLLELGAELNPHDLAGNTPLHHCLSHTGNEYTMKMAEVLLKQGADVNAVNRFGNVALQECVLTGNIPFIKLLIRYNADPLIMDNDGTSPMMLCALRPELRALLKVGERKVFSKERQTAKMEKNFKVCNNCQATGEKRCTGCFFVWYCGKSCQKTDWPAHSSTCKRIWSEYLRVEPADTSNEYVSTFAMPSKGNVIDMHMFGRGEFGGSNVHGTSQHVLKIQVPLIEQVGDIRAPLLCYNKSRTVNFTLSPKTEVGARLEAAVKKQGRGKSFFYGVIRNGKHFIHPEVLPPQDW
eukprot:TRINITY_DN5469_c0_g1_i1.p1 TRINITY_DN5469_c0_g1~~TRINITY_DN5469_c0_g1_i1.p1  ORF type:complete len:480 (+),score=129.38 TRINITY_DN5469_c0_g1_i1:34-1473(+)